MADYEKFISSVSGRGRMTRREMLKLFGRAGILSTVPSLSTMRSSYAFPSHSNTEFITQGAGTKDPDWIAEARIGGLTVAGVKADPAQLMLDLVKLKEQGVTVIEADSRLSDYLSEQDFATELKRIKDVTGIIHQHDLKVVWYIPSLEVLTPYGVTRQDSFARTHPDWLQVSFDGETKGVFYGSKVFWVDKNDESAWLCPNTPYREWFKNHLRQLAATGVDGLWLDVPIFDLIVVKWGCACPYCREKFTRQTGLAFPREFNVSDKAFWRFIRWRHDTITEFLDDCKAAIESGNPDTVTIAEIVALDHMGATQHGSEGSSMANILIVWEVDALSETTAMAEASYDDWIAMHNIYKYCRGATMDRPSWVFCYGYDEPDAQLVLASAVSAQNNPYELRAPEMTTTVGREFRQMMFGWIRQHNKQIFRSRSLAPAAVIYSERNRDFLDTIYSGGIFLSPTPPAHDRKWLGKKTESPVRLEYMGDYRGLSLMLYQNQIPTDIYPFSRVNADLLEQYSVLVLPYMATLTEAEKELLLGAVRNGATLIVTGSEPGLWDADGNKRNQSLWSDIKPHSDSPQTGTSLGKGRVLFWQDAVGQQYLKTHDDALTEKMLTWLKQAGVNPWLKQKLPAVVQPYIYENQIIIHVLNYSWVGRLANQPQPLKLELSVPWPADQKIVQVTQSEPQWSQQKPLTFAREGDTVSIPVEIGINAVVIIDLA